MAGHPVDGGPVRGDPNIIAMLSLNLLLLAFFILLNALSTFESQKVNEVMESVKQTFQGQLRAAPGESASAGAIDELPGGEDALDRIARLFESETPLVQREESEDSTVMKFVLPSGALFVGSGAELKPGRDLLLRRVTSVLLETRAERPNMDLELLYGSAVPLTEAVGRVAAQRVGTIARQMTAFDFDPASLAVSVVELSGTAVGGPGEGDQMVFIIRLYDRPQPAVDFAEVLDGAP